MTTTKKKYGKTLLACYTGFATQAICANFPPLLYVTFFKTYGISLSALAMISTLYFFSQLVIDFVCAKIVDRIGYRPCIIASCLTTGLGLLGLAFLPDLLPNPYAGVLISVVIYAIGSGLIEVLGSPIIEACPFDNKDMVMSTLHSFYCWGSAVVILGSTLFFSIFGLKNWKIMAVIWALIPLINTYNFATCPMEPLVKEGQSMTMGSLLKNRMFWLMIILMVCAGASEISMAQWASAFAESALGVSKAVGDIAGPAGFAISQALSRTLYGKFGDKVDLTVYMAASGILCLVCYLMAGLARIPILGLIGCALCGFSVGIMWPGSISISSRILPTGGTAMFALLALAGDLGGTIGPSIVGNVSKYFSNDLHTGILASIGFPIVLVICVLIVRAKKAYRP
jgi:fucose permease